MYLHNNKTKGSLKWIIIIVVGIILASYFFDFSVKDAVEDEQTQSNFNYIKIEVSDFYNEHLKKHVDYIWKDIFVDLIWKSFVGDLEKMKAGETPDAFKAGPRVNIEN